MELTNVKDTVLFDRYRSQLNVGDEVTYKKAGPNDIFRISRIEGIELGYCELKLVRGTAFVKRIKFYLKSKNLEKM